MQPCKLYVLQTHSHHIAITSCQVHNIQTTYTQTKHTHTHTHTHIHTHANTKHTHVAICDFSSIQGLLELVSDEIRNISDDIRKNQFSNDDIIDALRYDRFVFTLFSADRIKQTPHTATAFMSNHNVLGQLR